MAIYHLMYRTNAAGRIPAAADMPLGRLAVNLTDERLFFKNASNVVVEPQPRAHTHPISQISDLNKGLANGVAPLDASAFVPLANLQPGLSRLVAPVQLAASGSDLNVLTANGTWWQDTNAGAAAGSNYPEATAGLLMVSAGGVTGVTSYQQYVTINGTYYRRSLFNNTTWTTWTPDGDSIAVTAVQWWPSRASIPPGYVPADGQLLNRATFPDVANAVTNNAVPVITDANWLADPTKRGSYTPGDGSTTIRVPDYNGKSSGTSGRVFLSGDGTNSAGTDGLIQQDAFQGHRLGFTGAPLGNFGINATALNPGGLNIAAMRVDVQAVAGFITDGVNGAPRTATETRPTNVTGCFIIKVFGAVVNPGNVSIAQMAADIQAIKSGSLLEVGSSATGTYYKYASGDMVCFLNQLVPTPSGALTWTSGMPSYATVTGLGYPAAFIAQPILVGLTVRDSAVSGRSAYVATVNNLTTTSIGVTYIASPTTTPIDTGGNMVFTGTLIGRWK